MLTIRESDILGQLSPGDYYGTDLDPNSDHEIDRKFFLRTQKDAPPVLQLDALDNFDSMSMVHLIARKFVTVGYISGD